MGSTNDMLTLRDAARRLGLSISRLRVMVARREIGCARPGGPHGRIFIAESEINNHLRRHSRPARAIVLPGA